MDEQLHTFKFACAAQTLRRAARLITRRYEEALRPVNLTASQFTILQALNLHKDMPFSLVSNVLGMEQTTLSRLLKTLEKRDLVFLRSDEEDRRSRLVSITNKGRKLFVEAKDMWKVVNDESLSRLSQNQWRDVQQSLSNLSR